jgi:hypothetical protein
MKAAFGGVLLVVGLVLSGCAAESDALAEQYRAGTGQNYISGDGALTVVAPESRARASPSKAPWMWAERSRVLTTRARLWWSTFGMQAVRPVD